MIFTILGYYLILFGCLFAGVAVWKKIPAPWKVLTGLIWVFIVLECLATDYGNRPANNMPITHFSFVVEFVGLSLIYYQIWKHIRWFSNLVFAFMPAYIGFEIINLLYLEGPLVYPTYLAQLSTVCMVLYSTLSFYLMLQEKEIIPLARKAVFWFSVSNLIYFTGTLMFWSLYNYALLWEGYKAVFLHFRIVLTVTVYTHYILYIIAILAARKNNHVKRK